MILAVLCGGSIAFAGAAVTYHGRILDANDRPVEAANVVFKIQVRSPGTPNCLLYEETRTVNMLASDGIFVIPIGDGHGARTASDPGITVENVFSNNTALNHTSLACNSGTSYQPVALDSRRLVVSFNDGSGSGDQALPEMDLNYVPFSLHAFEAATALKVGAVPASQIMSVSSGAATPLSAANFAELLALVNGTSTAYVKPASVPACASGEVLKGTGGAFVCVSDASGTDTLAGISCIDGKILKRVAGSWACSDESGVGTESDPTVQPYAKAAPGTGLAVSGGVLAADFGTGAGKVVQGNDGRLTDSRAPNGSATGDLSGTYPNPTVKGIRGNAISATTPVDGQVYKWVLGATEFQPKYLGLADLKKPDGTPQLPATCAANETLSWSSVADVMTCVAINNLDASKITSGTIAYARLPIGTAANTVAAGDDSRFTNARVPTGAAGGELGGTFPNPTVAKLAGVALNVSSLTSGQILKYDGTNWVNAPDSGVGSESDPSVQQYAKSAPGTGLKVTSNLIVPDFGTGAGKVVEGNDARLSDNRVASDINGVVSTGILQRTGAGAFSTLGVAAPVTNSAGNIGLAVGTGLTLSSGSLVPDFGTSAGKVAQGSDARFPSATCASGNYNRWNGSAWVCDADVSTDSTKVLKSGDTMTGALALPSNGLAVGTSQLVVSGGNVGIGVTSPTQKLEVAGSVKIVDGTQGAGKVLTSDANGVASWAALSGTGVAGPSFSAHNGGTQINLTPGTWTKLTLGTESFDTNNNFTSGRFTPTVAGKYWIYASVNCPSGTTCASAIYKNGSYIRESALYGQTNQTPNLSVILDMNGTTDYVDIWGHSSDGIVSGGAVTNFSGALLAPLASGSVAGTGTANYVPMWSSSTNLTNSPLAVSSGNVGIGTTSPTQKLEVAGSVKIVDGTQGAGKVLTSDANGLASWQAAAGSASSATVLTCSPTSCAATTGSPVVPSGSSPYTWTKSDYTGGVALIECWGGGGAGGRSTTGGAAGGGGGGGYMQRLVPLAQLGATVTITVGSGAAGLSGNGVGGAGGASSFGTWVSAYGGGGGAGAGTSNWAAGGGGGGALSAGGNAPANTSTQPTGGQPDGGVGVYCGDDGYGGPAYSLPYTNRSGIYGGGGGAGGGYGGGNNSCRAGSSTYGGGGGGGCAGSIAYAAGASVNGGTGGAAGCASTNGTAGSVPAGGGGASRGATSGAGGAGQCRITIW